MVLTQHALQILHYNAQALRRNALPQSPELHLALQTKSFSFSQAWCRPPVQAAVDMDRGELDPLNLERQKAVTKSPRPRVLAESASHRYRDLGMEEPAMGTFRARLSDREKKTVGNGKWAVQSTAPSIKSRREMFAVMQEGLAAMREQLANKGAVSVDDRIENEIGAAWSATKEPLVDHVESVEIASLDGTPSEEALSLKQADQAVVQVVKTCDNVVLPML